MLFRSNSVQTAAPHIKSGKLRALAVTSAQPSALYPELPTLAATVPGYESAAIYGLLAPAKTPPAVISALQRAVVEHLKMPATQQRLFNAGVEVVGGLPEQLATMIKADVAKWSKVFKDSGIRAD